jgi:hypothetical protein
MANDPGTIQLLERRNMNAWVQRLSFAILLALPLSRAGLSADALIKEAAKYFPGVRWQEGAVTGNFTCQGRTEKAILGVSKSEILIAVFTGRSNKKPVVLRYQRTRNIETLKLTTEDLDYDPKAEIGTDLPGFQRSKKCSGLNLSDGEVDSAHIYWNHESHRFQDWTR